MIALHSFIHNKLISHLYKRIRKKDGAINLVNYEYDIKYQKNKLLDYRDINKLDKYSKIMLKLIGY